MSEQEKLTGQIIRMSRVSGLVSHPDHGSVIFMTTSLQDDVSIGDSVEYTVVNAVSSFEAVNITKT